MRVVVTGASGNVGTPTHGVTTSAYSRDKAYQERLLDLFERDHPGVRVVRLRPALTFKRVAASEIRRLFLGPLVPGSLARADAIPVVPKVKRLRTQAVHADDVGQAYRLAVVGDARGPFNLAAEPVLDADTLAGLLHARPVRVPAGLREGAGADTPPLDPQAGGPLRLGEFRTGVGGSA